MTKMDGIRNEMIRRERLKSERIRKKNRKQKFGTVWTQKECRKQEWQKHGKRNLKGRNTEAV